MQMDDLLGTVCYASSEGQVFCQKIADSWPASIDDSSARADWGWTNDFDMTTMTEAMFKNLKEQVYPH